MPVEPLSRMMVMKIVNKYIGVNSGYLGHFSYRLHHDFYPEHCDLDINPNDYEGTTRDRFIKIISGARDRESTGEDPFAGF